MLLGEVGINKYIYNAISTDTRIRYIRVSAKRQAREEAMRVESKRKVKAEQWVAEEEAARMEAER